MLSALNSLSKLQCTLIPWKHCLTNELTEIKLLQQLVLQSTQSSGAHLTLVQTCGQTAVLRHAMACRDVETTSTDYLADCLTGSYYCYCNVQPKQHAKCSRVFRLLPRLHEEAYMKHT